MLNHAYSSVIAYCIVEFKQIAITLEAELSLRKSVFYSDIAAKQKSRSLFRIGCLFASQGADSLVTFPS